MTREELLTMHASAILCRELPPGRCPVLGCEYARGDGDAPGLCQLGYVYDAEMAALTLRDCMKRN